MAPASMRTGSKKRRRIKKQRYSGVELYTGGIIFWVFLWVYLIMANNYWKFDLFGGMMWPLFSFPFLLGIFTLLVNGFLARSEVFSSYATELAVIEFVERNSSWFLVGSASIFAWASLAKGSLGLAFALTPFLIYVTLSLLLLSFSILLYWNPYDPKEAGDLGRLRHWKTIPFTYAVSFFTAAILTLLVGTLSR